MGDERVEQDLQDVQSRFGMCVRARREELGLSQESVGLRSGLHPTYVSSVERGRRNLSINSVVRLCVALSVLPSDVFRRCGM